MAAIRARGIDLPFLNLPLIRHAGQSIFLGRRSWNIRSFGLTNVGRPVGANVLPLFFTMSVCNICLGYALAVHLNSIARTPMTEEPEPAPEAVNEPPSPPPEPEPPTRDVIEKEITVETPPEEEIPEEWLAMLDDAAPANSFVEASIQVLRLEVGRYREKLIAIDAQIRAASETEDQTSLGTCLEELKQANLDWLERQAEASGHLQSRQGNLGDFGDIGSDLETILLEQTAQIETTCSNIDTLDFASDVAEGCRKLLNETAMLVDLAHSLRDGMQESLVAIMHHEGQLESLDANRQVDALTKLKNRPGLEAVFWRWWQDDPSRTRLASIGMIDIDKLSRINKEYGAPVGDRLVAAFGQLLTDLLRRDRGYDVPTRYAGQRFVIFFGDTGPRNAMGAVERIRQSIAETTFEYGGHEIELLASCAVTEVLPEDKTPSLFRRAAKALRGAKAAGGNCTFLDEGEGAKTVDPPSYEVKGRIVRIND